MTLVFHSFYLIKAKGIIKGSYMSGTNEDCFWEIVIILDFLFTFINHKVINLTRSLLNGFCTRKTSYHYINEMFHHPFLSSPVVWGIVSTKTSVSSENQCCKKIYFILYARIVSHLLLNNKHYVINTNMEL